MLTNNLVKLYFSMAYGSPRPKTSLGNASDKQESNKINAFILWILNKAKSTSEKSEFSVVQP